MSLRRSKKDEEGEGDEKRGRGEGGGGEKGDWVRRGHVTLQS